MNFPLILFIFLLLTSAIALLDAAYLKKRRAGGEAEPWWVEYSKSFFPVILLVFALR
ncbi:MAG: signal peptidase I, partial [Burkholderiales bacterium]